MLLLISNFNRQLIIYNLWYNSFIFLNRNKEWCSCMFYRRISHWIFILTWLPFPIWVSIAVQINSGLCYCWSQSLVVKNFTIVKADLLLRWGKNRLVLTATRLSHRNWTFRMFTVGWSVYNDCYMGYIVSSSTIWK